MANAVGSQTTIIPPSTLLVSFLLCGVEGTAHAGLHAQPQTLILENGCKLKLG